jgi:hypothetical protein
MKFRSMQILAALTAVAGAARVATAAEPASSWSLSLIGGDSIGERSALRRFDYNSPFLRTRTLGNDSSEFGLRFGIDADHVGKPPSADDARTGELGAGPIYCF